MCRGIVHRMRRGGCRTMRVGQAPTAITFEECRFVRRVPWIWSCRTKAPCWAGHRPRRGFCKACGRGRWCRRDGGRGASWGQRTLLPDGAEGGSRGTKVGLRTWTQGGSAAEAAFLPGWLAAATVASLRSRSSRGAQRRWVVG